VKGSRRDPFEGLVLDEHFVRSARFTEPTASDRVRRRKPVTGLPGRLRWARRLGWRSVRQRRFARALTMLSLFAAFAGIAFGVYRQAVRAIPAPSTRAADVTVRVFNRGDASAAPAATAGKVPLTAGGSVDPAASAASVGGAPTATGPAIDPNSGPDSADTGAPGPAWETNLRVGDCVAPTTVDGSPLLTLVPCATPHPEEVSGIVDLGRRFGPWPGQTAIIDLAQSACRSALIGYTGSRVTQSDAAAMVPGRSAWDAGARRVICTIRLPFSEPGSGASDGPVLASPARTISASLPSAVPADTPT
jgi:Septum formation